MGDERDDLRQQVDNLSKQVAANRADIDSLGDRADASNHRADVANHRADVSEARSAVDREMIAELQADGVLSREHVAQLEIALQTSRIIGAAIGMIMASRLVSQDEAFAMLKRASQNGNVKLRDLAADMVEHGRLSILDQD